jgi:hypothetical protein
MPQGNFEMNEFNFFEFEKDLAIPPPEGNGKKLKYATKI